MKSVASQRKVASREVSMFAPLGRPKTIGRHDDPVEAAADRVSEKAVGRAPARNDARGRTPGAVKGGIPGDVQRVLDTPGHPLDDKTRAFLEPRFGFDFSKVRIHDDGLAALSATAIGGRAYTAGAHIVFAKSEYALGSTTGRSLLAHELAHLVQAKSASATATVIRRAPAPPLEYITGTQTFSPPASGTTMASIAADVKAKQTQKPDPDLGPTVNVTGVSAGQPEEIYVWNVLLQRAQRQFWGTQIQVVTQIGPSPPAPPGGAAPVGQIILRIDKNGNATAELADRGPVAVPSAFPDETKAMAALKTDFGFASVDDGTAHWALADLNKVHTGLTRLPASDRAALAGVKLERDSTLTDSAGKPRAGEFEKGASVTPGSPGTPSVASQTATLKIADLAFRDDATSFQDGGGTAAVASIQTVLHEAGHAVETKALRDAQFATFEAQAESNNATLALNAEQGTTNTAVSAANGAGKTAIAAFNKYSNAQKTTALAFVNAYQAAVGAVNSYANNTAGSRFASLETAAAAAIAKRDAENAKLPAGHPAPTDFAAALTTQNSWFTAAQARAKASIKLDASKADLSTKKSAQGTVSDAAGTGSKRLAKFVTLVNAKHITPLTQYAKDNWPRKPAEFFAEAYSLWLSNPTYLNDNAPDLKAWFDAGEHLK
jgi:hypothetical protein